MSNNTDISVVVPVYNSEAYLELLVDDLKKEFTKNNRSFEIILVNDGSKDKSWEVIKKIRLVNPEVKGFNLSKNYGQHKAIFCGLNNCHGEVVITMDDDFEHPIDQIEPIVTKLLQSDNDIIYAVSDKNNNRGLFRSLATRLYRALSKFENHSGGNGSSYRFMKLALVKNLCTHNGHLFVLDELILWHTSFIDSAKVTFGKSKKSTSGYSYFSLIALVKNIFILSTTAPLVIMKFIGMSVSSVSFLVGLYYLLRKVIFKVPPGYTSVIVSVLFGTGLILLCLAIIGEYLGNILMMQNKKPAYTIKDKT